jgi:Flp pilus assembly protein TadB
MSGEVQEKWMKWVAMTTTILAVCAAIGSLKGGGYSTQVQLMTTQENNKWSYFQSKSIKQHITEMETDLLKLELYKADKPALKEEISAKIKSAEENIARYDKEKATIKTDAEGLSAKQGVLKRHGGNFGLSVMFFQIAIMLSAIGSLLKQKSSWICGLVIGGAGLVYFLNGFFLFF